MNIDLKGVEATLVDPIFANAIKHLETFISFSEAAKLPVGNANVRGASASKKPWKAMLATVEQNPEHFHLLNRGVIYRAKRTSYDATKQVLRVVLPETDGEQRYGIADGGHTLSVVRYCVENKDAIAAQQTEDGTWVEPYVRVRFIVGEGLGDDLDTIVEALNTSTQVQQYTLDEYHGSFDDLKVALHGAGWLPDSVSYRENDPGDWDVREIVQRMSVFLKDRWQDEAPIAAYKSRARSMALFTGDETHEEFVKLYGVIDDIVTMPERIQAEFSLGESITNRRRLAVLPHVQTLTKPLVRPGSPRGWPTGHRFNMGALLPLAAAFRELLTLKGGHWVWSISPDAVLHTCAQDLFDLMIKRGKVLRTANALGTDIEYWTAATSIVLRAVSKVPKTMNAGGLKHDAA